MKSKGIERATVKGCCPSILGDDGLQPRQEWWPVDSYLRHARHQQNNNSLVVIDREGRRLRGVLGRKQDESRKEALAAEQPDFSPRRQVRPSENDSGGEGLPAGQSIVTRRAEGTACGQRRKNMAGAAGREGTRRKERRKML